MVLQICLKWRHVCYFYSKNNNRTNLERTTADDVLYYTKSFIPPATFLSLGRLQLRNGMTGGTLFIWSSAWRTVKMCKWNLTSQNLISGKILKSKAVIHSQHLKMVIFPSTAQLVDLLNDSVMSWMKIKNEMLIPQLIFVVLQKVVISLFFYLTAVSVELTVSNTTM